MLKRIEETNGTTANVVRWTMPQTGTVNFMRMALLAHNEWLENLLADDSRAPYAKRSSATSRRRSRTLAGTTPA